MDYQKDSDILKRLYENGVINIDRNPTKLIFSVEYFKSKQLN